MKIRILKGCVVFGLVFILISVPYTIADEQEDYDATVEFQYYADEDHGYSVEVTKFQVPDRWDKNEPFTVRIIFNYHIGLDEADNIMYDVSWCGYISLQQGGSFQPPTWNHVAFVNPYDWEPGVGDKETFYKTFEGISGPQNFEAKCWMTYYVYTWDDINQEWDYWKHDDDLEDHDSKTITFPENFPYLEENTSILMSDETTKGIKDVNINDYVMAYDFFKNCTIATKVVDVYNISNESNYIKINNIIYVSPKTRLFINEEWIYAENASIGDYMFKSSGLPEQITSIQTIYSSSKMYGFKVENYSSFFAENFLIQTNNLFS